MADPMSNYLGGPRHAPRAEVAAPELLRRNPVASFSRPAMDSDVAGTGALLSGPKRNRGRGGQTMGALQQVASPLDLSASDDIIAASGLAGNADNQKRPGEPDAPSQAVETQPDGSLVHHRVNPASGRVQSTPVGAYSSKPRYRGQYNDAGDLNYFEE